MFWRPASLWALIRVKLSPGSAYVITAVTLGGEWEDFERRRLGQMFILALVTIVGHLYKKEKSNSRDVFVQLL